MSSFSETTDWVDPSLTSEERLTTEQLLSWKNRGFVLVQDLLPADLLADVKRDALSVFPKPTDAKARNITDFGGGVLKFPSEFRAVNKVALHENLINTIGELLEIPCTGKVLGFFLS